MLTGQIIPDQAAMAFAPEEYRGRVSRLDALLAKIGVDVYVG